MTIDWSRVLPVLVSIGVIISIAVLRQYSKTIAAIAAVMPINIPLGMWIVYSGTESKAAYEEFVSAMTINLLPTFIFTIVAWWMVRQQYGFIPTIIAGYVAWAIGLGLVFGVRHYLGSA